MQVSCINCSNQQFLTIFATSIDRVHGTEQTNNKYKPSGLTGGWFIICGKKMYVIKKKIFARKLENTKFHETQSDDVGTVFHFYYC